MQREEKGSKGKKESKRRRPPRSSKELRIAWCNTQNAPAPHITLLEVCWNEGIDVVQVQEPWARPDTKTQNHIGFETYAPIDSWTTYDERPRVMTYVRKNRNIKAQQRRPAQSREMLWLDVNGYSLLNVYRQPGQDNVIDYVTRLIPPTRCLIGGDWNVWHPEFEPGIGGLNRGADLVQWLHSSGMAFTGVPGQPTHRAGHVLDLVFSNIPFVETTVVESMATGSDHSTLVSTIPGRGYGAPARLRYKVREEDLERFSHLVAAGVASLPEVASVKTPAQLNECVNKLSEVFASATEAVGKPAGDRAHSAPW